ncbi:hypothetical protein DEIPH_ctg004orf0210 [Deinococcus phoenicis]|uniref:Uncharacterized protein n=1 Tax=Deinococcus phoenicis TaxID=1476583 RepID=A0A016QV66_9DEIO|nr:hypothetical protein [Deinococcus phoenicis]EYB69674.1 hypothetical protein DEIPH_ctg004orf0210 [Deinococcus phoenicis]
MKTLKTFLATPNDTFVHELAMMLARQNCLVAVLQVTSQAPPGRYRWLRGVHLGGTRLQEFHLHPDDVPYVTQAVKDAAFDHLILVTADMGT